MAIDETDPDRPPGPRILLVEDEPRLARPLVAALRRHGYEVLHVANAAGALTAPACDLILLDLGLPDRDGLRVCAELRERGDDVPIVMLTARSEEAQRVAGLRGGADDYLVKPFGFAELEARIQAVLRRAGPRRPKRYVVGDLVVDLASRTAYARGEPLGLSRKEYQLLAALVAEPAGFVHRRERLLLDVWNTAEPGDSRTLDVHVAALRSKLAGFVAVETVRGVGYRLVVPAEHGASDEQRVGAG
jgi:DNA-binding response OmpR family regulator